MSYVENSYDSTTLSLGSCCLMNFYLSYFLIKTLWLWLVTGFYKINLSFSSSMMLDLLEVSLEVKTLPAPFTFLSSVCNPSIYVRYFFSPISYRSLPFLENSFNLSCVLVFLSFLLVIYSGYSSF